MRAQVLLVAITASVGTVVAAPPAAAGLSDSGGTTSRASVSAAGEQANASSGYPLEISARERGAVALDAPPYLGHFGAAPRLSSDGRYLMLVSHASNLVPAAANVFADVFVRDLQTGAVEQVSVSTEGAPANGDSSDAAFSADGRYVAFTSRATNLSADDVTADVDLYLRDRVLGTTTRVPLPDEASTGGGDTSTGTRGKSGKPAKSTTGSESTAPDLGVDEPVISADGSVIAFLWGRSSGDSRAGLYVLDRTTGTYTRGDLLADGRPAEDPHDPALSGDGRHLAFTGRRGPYGWGLWVRDLVTGVLRAGAVNACGKVDVGSDSVLSHDGSRLAFSGDLACDGSGMSNVYVRDLAAGVTYRASATSFPTQPHGHSYDPAISPDGRWVAFASYAHNMTHETDRCLAASAGLVGGNVYLGCWDIYVKDLTQRDAMPVRVSVSSAGEEADWHSWSPTLSADGTRVAFVSLATNLVHSDTNRTSDVFVHDIGAVRAPLPGPLSAHG